MHQHHQSPNPHKVGTVGETNEKYGGDVMNHLLLEILKHTEATQHGGGACIGNTSAALHLRACPPVVSQLKPPFRRKTKKAVL